jgi:hypothetical protein
MCRIASSCFALQVSGPVLARRVVFETAVRTPTELEESKMNPLREGFGGTREKCEEDWFDVYHDPSVVPAEPPAPASEAPAGEAEFSIMLYSWVKPQSVFYCSRDLFCDVLRTSLSEMRLDPVELDCSLVLSDICSEILSQGRLARRAEERMLEWVESHPEGVPLLIEAPLDWLESHPEWVLQLADGHAYWARIEFAIEKVLDSRRPYRVHCLYCKRTYEASAVLVDEWYHDVRFGRSSGCLHKGRVFMCPEKHSLWETMGLMAN